MLAEEGKLLKADVNRTEKAAETWKAAGNIATNGSDLDHLHDLRLGGKRKDVGNLGSLDASVYESLGSQIGNQLRNMENGAHVKSVKIE